MATSVLPDVPVAYLISLDANCLSWETDDPPDITAYFSQFGNPFWWDSRDPCDHCLIPGVSDPQDTEDVIWPSVDIDLEVRSNDLFGVQDVQLSHRTDGSRGGILT